MGKEEKWTFIVDHLKIWDNSEIAVQHSHSSPVAKRGFRKYINIKIYTKMFEKLCTLKLFQDIC